MRAFHVTIRQRLGAPPASGEGAQSAPVFAMDGSASNHRVVYPDIAIGDKFDSFSQLEKICKLVPRSSCTGAIANHYSLHNSGIPAGWAKQRNTGQVGDKSTRRQQRSNRRHLLTDSLGDNFGHIGDKFWLNPDLVFRCS